MQVKPLARHYVRGLHTRKSMYVCILLYTYMHVRNLKVYKIEKLELPMEGNPRSNPGIDMALK